MTPGRRLALVTGVPVLLVLIGWTGLNAVAFVGQASFPVRGSIPVSDGRVTARIDGGDITLRQTGVSAVRGGTAELTGTAHYSLFRPSVTISGSTVTFPCGLPVGDCYLNAALWVPADTMVSLFTSGGDATVPGFSGGRLTVRTDGGDVTAGDLAGRLDLGTGGGDLTAAALDGPVQVATGGGNLTVRAMRAPTASISSGGGDVWLAYAAAPDSIQVTSGGGNVTLVLPRGRYKVALNAGGGTEHNAVGDDPSAGRSITVDSEGGNITIAGAS
jgi:Putative adhesin